MHGLEDGHDPIGDLHLNGCASSDDDVVSCAHNHGNAVAVHHSNFVAQPHNDGGPRTDHVKLAVAVADYHLVDEPYERAPGSDRYAAAGPGRKLDALLQR
ncbi:hypothetical protein [Arthrobacter sp. M4]|uniref:hypothetical protein n=1 Tax=Arthrobacter sp. M4 TaxID=218160 RepID=UPI001CDB969C|nr:hypothetical protein [Arthrobacter sp. M4]MCA4134947.1 hypothetical protein [Arthrobacter sp. M4]